MRCDERVAAIPQASEQVEAAAPILIRARSCHQPQSPIPHAGQVMADQASKSRFDVPALPLLQSETHLFSQCAKILDHPGSGKTLFIHFCRPFIIQGLERRPHLLDILVG